MDDVVRPASGLPTEIAGKAWEKPGTFLARAGPMPTRLFTATLPNSRTRAVSLLALFAAVQVADAVMTWTGVERFGPAAEANPILCYYLAVFGVSVTLIGAKSSAVILATALYCRSHHLTLAILTLVYVVGAIDPWAWILMR